MSDKNGPRVIEFIESSGWANLESYIIKRRSLKGMTVGESGYAIEMWTVHRNEGTRHHQDYCGNQ